VTLIAPDGALDPDSPDLDGAIYHPYKVYGRDKPENATRNFVVMCRNVLSNVYRVFIDIYRAPLWLSEIFATSGICDASETLSHIFVTKQRTFIDGLIKMEKFNAYAFDAIGRHIRAGISELDLLDKVTSVYSQRGGGNVSMICNITGGARSADPNNGTSAYKLRGGDCLIADLRVNAGGYCVDAARAFFVGKASKEKRMAYTAVLDALRRGEDMLKPGVVSSDIFNEVSGSLTQAGYQKLSRHTGHGIGYTWDEPPYFIPKCGDKLEPGMIVTLEPGVYIEDSFGIRIENNYIITDSGFENIFDYPESIESFIH